MYDISDTNFIKDYGVIIGAVLAILSNPINALLNNRRDRENFIKGLGTELTDIKIRALASLFQTSLSTKQFNKEFLVWYREHLTRIPNEVLARHLNGVNPFEQIQALDENNEAKIISFIAKNPKGNNLMIPPINMPYLNSQISLLHLLKTNPQAFVFKIQRTVSVVNNKILQMESWNRMTFQITDTENHKRCVQNEDNCLLNIFLQTRILVDQIHEYFQIDQSI